MPLPQARVHAVADGERVVLGERTLELIHTPGHALHHYAVVDAAHRSIFPGDTFGISYRAFDTANGAFIFPTTTPTQFDPEQLVASIDRMLGYGPAAMYLMHFSRVTDVARLGESLKEQVRGLAQLARAHAADQDPAQGLSGAIGRGVARRGAAPRLHPERCGDHAPAGRGSRPQYPGTAGVAATAGALMSDTFRAFRIHSEDGRIAARFEDIRLDDLAAGEVVIRVSHSGINYKDALAATGAGKILRRYPLVGGIDLAGTVESSADARYREGDEVLVTGCALSETHDGGYAECARVRGDWVIPMPEGMNAFDVMAIGTAGFTAALAIHRMEVNGQAPAMGPIVVTGATGGVGSLAIDMLKRRGYRVIALSGKSAAVEYLKEIGADEVLARQGLDLGTRALESARFGGAIDNLGASSSPGSPAPRTSGATSPASVWRQVRSSGPR